MYLKSQILFFFNLRERIDQRNVGLEQKADILRKARRKKPHWLRETLIN